MTTLRKNASLKTVAKHARRKANAKLNAWRRQRDEIAANPCGASFQLRCDCDATFSRYTEMDEIATHLERLAGLSR